jgi:hypothetical protein
MEENHIQDYLQYAKWLIFGWVFGLILGKILDNYVAFGNPVFEGITRFIAGAGDTLGGLIGIIIHRIKNDRKSAAETFAIGTLIGTAIAPILHFLTILLGFNTGGIAGAIYSIAYSNADNWGGVIFALRDYIKKTNFRQGLKLFRNDIFVCANLIILILLGTVDIFLRSKGLAPTSYFLAALEGSILNNDSSLSVLIFYIWTKMRKRE